MPAHRLAVLLALVVAAPARAAVTCPDGATLDGIDVSKWQGSIDWQQVASSGVRYAFIRVNHGLEDIDERFDENWAGAAANGVVRGAYQYFLNEEDALDQADLLLERMGALAPGDLPPVIDVEDDGAATPAELREKIWSWLERVEGALGVKPFLYTGRYYWESRVQTAEFEEAGFPLWFANYDVECPNLPLQLSEWVFWQRSSTGSVLGIAGNVDLDVFNGDEAALWGYTVDEPSCGDGRCTGGESHESCAEDCRGCEPVPPAGRVLDEKDRCVTFSGTPEAWRWNGDYGYDGALRWTHAWTSATPDNQARYDLELEVGGSYEVQVYIDAAAAPGTAAARYSVRHAGSDDEVLLDQASAAGWVSLGAHDFAAGADQSVTLVDNTGEPASEQRRVLFDAIRLLPVDVDVPDAGPALDDDAGAVLDDDGGPLVAGDDAGGYEALPASVTTGCACRQSTAGMFDLAAATVLLAVASRGRRPRVVRKR